MLQKLFNPRSVAVVGASSHEQKVGYAVMKNLIDAGFKGPIYPINAKGGPVLGIESIKGFADLKEPVDLAVFVIPASTVLKEMQTYGGTKFGAAIVISAGFKEVGKDGTKLENELKECAAQKGVRVVGPNCLGLLDTYSQLNASFGPGMPEKGSIALLSQSGALGTAVLDWAIKNKLGLSKFISIGNKMDLNEIDFIEALAKDDDTKVILGYIEGIADGPRFMECVRKVTKVKPVILFKSGTTQAGAKAASSHTGTLAGAEAAYDAAFKQTGVIRAHSIEELFDYAIAFSYQPLPKGSQVAVLTNAGGPGIMAADCVETSRLKMAQIPDPVKAELAKVLPSTAAFNNPVDVIGDAGADRYENALKILNAQDFIDAIYVILTPQSMTQSKETAQAICETARNSNKTFICSFIGGPRVDNGIEVLSQGHIPNYFSSARGVKSLETMYMYAQSRSSAQAGVNSYPKDKDKAASIFQACMAAGNFSLTEKTARDIISAYGFCVPKGTLAKDAQDAASAAEQIGYPVVMKIASDDISHKSDVGGVKVNLKNSQEVLAAYNDMMTNIPGKVPGARIDGVMIQQMLMGGAEVILGITRDAQFGPLLMFGLGGIYVEVLKDISFRVCPVTRIDAEKMVKEIKTYALLKGVRGQKGINFEELYQAIEKLSALACDFPQIQEIDINPLKVYPEGQGPAVAVDARVILK